MIELIGVFFRCIIEKMSFHEKWVEWISMCAKIVNYSIMINGEGVGNSSPRRGLWQDEPLSPYLFIICIEALTTLSKLLTLEEIFIVLKCVKEHQSSHTYYMLTIVFCFARPQKERNKHLKIYREGLWESIGTSH